MEWLNKLQGKIIGLDTAPLGGASFFLTNDIRLPSLPGLTVLVLNQLMS
jgi:hypothetical protein